MQNHTAAVLPKLRDMVFEDIISLNRQLANKDERGPLYLLIRSLIRAKKKVLKLLPDTPPLPPDAHPNITQQPFELRNAKNNFQIRDRRYMPKILLDLEMRQLNFIRNVARSKNISKDVRTTLNEVLSIYFKVTDQLGRNIKSANLHTIVL